MKIGAICTDNAANTIEMAAARIHLIRSRNKQLLVKESTRDKNGDYVVIKGAPGIRDALVRVACIISYIQCSKGATVSFRNNLGNSKS